MASRGCFLCKEKGVKRHAMMKRPKNGIGLCKECFYFEFEREVHLNVIENAMFRKGDVVAIGASGGKDSTVLIHLLKLLNERFDYGIELYLLSIDEGISGYRDDSLETVKRNSAFYQIPLRIVSFKELFGWSMDEIVGEIGKRNNCTYCGVFRRQALDKGALSIGADCIATGHNADDVAETILMNLLRGDIARLERCTNPITDTIGSPLTRCKPLHLSYEKEIVMYAHFKRLDYFSTECSYSPEAYRGFARDFLKRIERIKPSAILDIIHSGQSFVVASDVSQKLPLRQNCVQCGFISSNRTCKACVMLAKLDNQKHKPF